MKNKNLFQSIRCAFQGLLAAFSSERNFTPYTIIAGVFFVLNLWQGVNRMEWVAYIIVTGAVIGAELLNTALERTLDYFTQDIHPHLRDVKDIAAAAVLVQGFVFFGVEAIILIPKIQLMIGGL